MFIDSLSQVGCYDVESDPRIYFGFTNDFELYYGQTFDILVVLTAADGITASFNIDLTLDLGNCAGGLVNILPTQYVYAIGQPTMTMVYTDLTNGDCPYKVEITRQGSTALITTEAGWNFN